MCGGVDGVEGGAIEGDGVWWCDGEIDGARGVLVTESLAGRLRRCVQYRMLCCFDVYGSWEQSFSIDIAAVPVLCGQSDRPALRNSVAIAFLHWRGCQPQFVV